MGVGSRRHGGRRVGHHAVGHHERHDGGQDRRILRLLVLTSLACRWLHLCGMRCHSHYKSLAALCFRLTLVLIQMKLFDAI